MNRSGIMPLIKWKTLQYREGSLRLLQSKLKAAILPALCQSSVSLFLTENVQYVYKSDKQLSA